MNEIKNFNKLLFIATITVIAILTIGYSLHNHWERKKIQRIENCIKAGNTCEECKNIHK